MHLPVYLDADGNIGPASGGTLYSASLTAAGDTATLTLADANGTVLKLSATANTTAGHTFVSGVVYHGQLAATFTGTTPVATCEV